MSATSTPVPFRSWPRCLRSPLAACFALPLAGLTLMLTGPGASTVYAQATARPPERLSFQGFLVDGNGNPLGQTAPKNYDVIFQIYDAETEGQLKWTESQTVTVDQGHFSVLLGEGIAVGTQARPPLSTLFKGADASQRFVQITVAGIGPSGADAIIQPRLQLLTSPYAFLSEQSTRLVSGESGEDILTSSAVGNSHQLSINGSLSVANSLTASSFAGNGSALTGVVKSTDLGGIKFNDGHLWLDSPNLGINGYGKALIFSSPAENTDPLWMARYHTNSNQTELRINIGDDPGNNLADKLVIGATLGSVFNQTGAWTPRFTFDSRGLLGVGTNAPEVTLHVNGHAAINGSSVLEFGRGVAGKQVDAGKIGYGTWEAGALNIVGGGTTGTNRRVHVYAEGGATFTGPVNVGNGMDIRTNGARVAQFHNTALRLFDTSNQNRFVDLLRYTQGVAFVAYGGGFGNNSSATRQAVWDGDSNWDFSSDRKFKKNIVDAESVLDRALQVKFRRYHWKDEGDDGEKEMGVIAQELQPLFPDMVGRAQDPTTKEEHLTVGYAHFGLIAVKALQEFKVLHDQETSALRAELAALKAERKAQAEAEKARSMETAALQERLSALEKLLQETIAVSKINGEAKTAQVAR